MQFLLSSWFIGLSALSLLIMGAELWGVLRACRKHDASPIGSLCGKGGCLPTMATVVMILFYVLLTIAYILLPPLLHDLT